MKMVIDIGRFGFQWERHAATRLWAPEREFTSTVVLYRDAAVFDTAEVRCILDGIDQDGSAQFYGLQRVFGTPYNRNIVASRFNLGDRLEIDLPVQPGPYWKAMQ